MSDIEKVQRFSEESNRNTIRGFVALDLALITIGVAIGARITHNTVLLIVAAGGLVASGAGFIVSTKIADHKGKKSEELFNSLDIDNSNPHPTYMSPHIRPPKLPKH